MITSLCWISVNAHATIKDDTVFACYCVFEWTRKHDYSATTVTGSTQTKLTNQITVL